MTKDISNAQEVEESPVHAHQIQPIDIESGTHRDEEEHGGQHAEVQKRSSDKLGSQRTPWYGTTLLLLAEVMGTGVLSLPHSAVTLGWGVSMTAVPLFAALASYSGYLLSKVKQEFPSFKSYADASTELISPWFGTFTKICMLLNWGSLGIYYLIATADALGNVSTSGFLGCGLMRTIVAAVILLLPSQCRDFHSISKFLSIPSTLAIIATIVIIVTALALQSSDGQYSFGEDTTKGPIEGTSVTGFLTALSAFIFAFQGQSIFLELMSEMKEARRFPLSCNVSYSVMAFIYAFTIIASYGIKGGQVPGFLPDVLETGPAKTAAGILIMIHIVVAYVVTCQPLHVWFHSTIFPKTLYKSTARGTFHWFVVSGSFIVFGWTIANLIPFFADVQALIASLFGAPILFGWPPAFVFMLNRKKAKSWREALLTMGYGNVAVCSLFLFFLAPLFVVLGTYGAVQAIVIDSQNAGGPFSCA